jgi:hypothetical protein
MRTPHTTVVVPVTATAANKARSSKGRRFHIDRPKSTFKRAALRVGRL